MLLSLLREDRGLRVRLKLNDPEIAAWPWEYLFDPSGKGFLAFSVLERLQPATRRELERRLDRPEPCHVLHIVGHGRFDGDRPTVWS